MYNPTSPRKKMNNYKCCAIYRSISVSVHGQTSVPRLMN